MLVISPTRVWLTRRTLQPFCVCCLMLPVSSAPEKSNILSGHAVSAVNQSTVPLPCYDNVLQKRPTCKAALAGSTSGLPIMQ